MVFRSSLESWLSLPHHNEPVSLLSYSLVLIVNAVRDFRAKYYVSLRDFQAIEFGLLPECFEKQFKGMIYTIRMHKNGRMLNLFRLHPNFARSRLATEKPNTRITFKLFTDFTVLTKESCPAFASVASWKILTSSTIATRSRITFVHI